MNHHDSEEIDNYLVEFESNAELYGNDIESFIEQRSIDAACAEQIRGMQELGRNIDLLAGADLADSGERNRAEDLTNELKGEYRFIRELGRGGMGTVWLAEQLMPQREVAIKLILTDLDSQLVKRRFESEQQSLAMMSHSGIAKVIDAGSIDGKRPYFVMEYVDGIPITNYCNDNRLSLDDRLSLFLQLCDAIQHAHQKGVIHRDIKPNNILVTQIDSNPQVKVIDFGLAKFLSGQGANLQLTQANVTLGSPMWMSPEQTQLKTKGSPSAVDTRSDVYSLGVILYQLLTNTMPIDSKRFEDVDRAQFFDAIRNEVPPYPSRRVADNKRSTSWLESQSTSGVLGWKNTLRDDLDWVTMKALEKEPDRRYSTVAALADDLRRFISGNTVVARPPSATYQLKKCIARNKAASIAVAVASLLLIACIVMAATTMKHAALLAEEKSKQAEIAKNEAIRRSQQNKAARELAETARKQAETARKQAIIDKEITDRVFELITRDIRAADVYANDVKFSEQNVKRMLRLAKDIHGMNLPLDREIRLRMHVAHNLQSLGEESAAREEYGKTLKLAESKLESSSPITMQVRNRLAFACFDWDIETARRLLKANKALLVDNSDVDSEIRLRCELGIAKAQPTPSESVAIIDRYRDVTSKCQKQLAEGQGMDDGQRKTMAALTVEGLTFLGKALSNSGKHREADRVLKEAESLSDQFIGVDSMQSHNLEIDILTNKDILRGSVHLATREAYYLDKFVEKFGESSQHVVNLRTILAGSLMRAGKLGRALEVVEEGIRACQRSSSDRQQPILQLYWIKFLVFNKLKRFSDATELFENKVASNLLNGIERDNFRNLLIQQAIAISYKQTGDSARAKKIIDTYEPIAKKVEGDSGRIRNLLRSLKASMLEDEERYEEAVTIRKDIVVELTKAFEDNPQRMSHDVYSLGVAIDLAGRPIDATEIFESLSKSLRNADPGRLNYLQTLAEHYLYEHKHKQALELCEMVQKERRAIRSQRITNEYRFRNQFCHAEAAAHLGRLDIAKDLLKKIKIDAAEFVYLRDRPEMDRLNLINGTCNRQNGEFQTAETLLLSGLSKVRKKSGLERLQSIQNTLAARRYAFQLATLYEEWGKPEKAREFRDMKFEFEPPKPK